ncbi:MAG: FAD-dependent oxidoreductase [Nitriliruptoraceae bacterium]
MRIAVVGSGISGLAAAWLLSRRHDIQVFEGQPRIGGHTDTRMVPSPTGTPVPIDTGFIVYNEHTYPLLVQLLDELDVATQPSSMSWSLTCAACDLEYAGNARGLFAQPRRLADPRHLRMVRDLLAFNRLGRQLRHDPAIANLTLGEFLSDEHGRFGHRFGRPFARHYLLPMTAAIWSSGTATVGQFPLKGLLEFLDNHGLLGVRTHHPWRTVVGGSAAYLRPLTAPLEGRIHVGRAVAGIQRHEAGATLRFDDERQVNFDAVIVATHADQALHLLDDPSPDEKELLGAWTYSRNDRWLHTDTRLLPRRRAAWASWNYRIEDCAIDDALPTLSYHANRLQNLDESTDYLVTLNPSRPPDQVIARDDVTHPTYTLESMATHDDLAELNGVNHTWFAGAYQRWGFHEDGLWSAVRVAEDFGLRWPS